ncbi:MAG TPA: CHAT domain-containing protein [Pyrinomonadaceae bacterium]|nr:CHAT domain-containing protein [Pyrinomonadaceae bacterium]
MQAKEMQASGYQSIQKSNALAISQFEKSRDLFEQLGDTAEARLAEIWAVQLLPEVAKIAASRRRLLEFITFAANRKFQVLLPTGYYWLANGEFHQNEISDSNKHFRMALRLAEAGDNTFEVQHVQDNLASNYSELAELEPALFYAGKMLHDRELYYQSASQYRRDKGTLSGISLKLGFFSTALNLSQESLEIARETWPGQSMVNDSLRRVIFAAAAKEDFATALKYANDSMQLALKAGQSAENTRMTARINLLLANLKSQKKDCDNALTDYDKALELYQLIPEFSDRLYEIHKGKLFCFQQLSRQEDFSSELNAVLKLSEKYRATIREDESRQAFFASEQVIYDAAAANALERHDSRVAFDFVEASKSRSLLDFVESGKTIAEVEKKFGPVAQPLSLTEIQARMPEQVQLVQYAVLPDRLAIWVLSKSRFDLIEKPVTATELERKIEAYQTSIIAKGSPDEIHQAGRELYDLLVPAGLEGARQLCIVSDSFLHQLAFASLVAPSGKYLVQEFALSYAPSASVLVLASEDARRKEQVTNEGLLSIGNPDFDREENSNLADLQAAATEARDIAGDYRKSLQLLSGEATKDQFLRNFADFEVVHFAGHFVANRQSPGNSKLLFAGGDLRSKELGAFKLPKVKLFVLSACETGFERYNKSEGAIGIARTLLALGAPLVVASQWQVDSEPTKDLMLAFHRNRTQKGMTSAESLRQAQLEMLDREETKAPVYWAAFSLYGGYANY